MPDIEVNIDVWCESCGAAMCNQTTASEQRGRPCFNVEPCNRCLEKSRQEGYDAGYEKGYDVGYEKGYDDKGDDK